MNEMLDQSMMQMPQMPAPIAPIMSTTTSDTIASMRWENDPLIVNLRIRLGGYTAVASRDGSTGLQRTEGMHPMVNDLGIDRLVALIQGVVNPVTSLSNIDDEEANTLIRQILYGVIRDLVYNQDRYEIDSGDKTAVMDIIKSIVFMQVKRAVSGHESRNFRTQTIEQNLQQNMTMPKQQGSMFNPFSWGRR